MRRFLQRGLLPLAFTVVSMLASSCFMPLMGGEKASGPRYVGILYETWFNHLLDDGRLSVPTYPDPPAPNGRRYWGTPALGQYLSDDPAVYQNHADLLTAAGIDFLLVDYSNGNIHDDQMHRPIHTLIQVFLLRLSEGKKVPKLAFLINARESDLDLLDSDVYERYGRNPDLFFYYEGKPLLCPLQDCAFPVTAQYTLRPTWGLLLPGDNSWSFVEPYPQRISKRGGKAEQMPVSAAQQASYMSATESARGRNWNFSSQSNDGASGDNFAAQWKLALMIRPKVVIVKSWNEWISYGPYYTDEFNSEFSNDLEPMEGGHGDRYYRALKDFVGVFKAGDF